jgi:hypothetical protein
MRLHFGLVAITLLALSTSIQATPMATAAFAVASVQ